MSQDDNAGANFETAIAASGFGKFNLLLLLSTIPAAWTLVLEVTSMSYVIPIAECDLNLTLEDKGMLNAVIFIGMIPSGMIWGFLSDTLGRRKILVVCYFLDWIAMILSGLAQNFWMLLIAKFIGGAIITGPIAVLTTYLSEFHGDKTRAKILMIRGLLVQTGNILVPLLTWAIIPLDIAVVIFGGKIRFFSWNVYLLVCSFPSMISGLAFFFMPESPKFLISSNRPKEALTVFQKIYKINSGKPATNFPIDRIATVSFHNLPTTTNESQERTTLIALKRGFKQMTPLFSKLYRRQVVHISFIHIALLMSINTLAMWIPQIFTTMNIYQQENDKPVTICSVFGVLQHSKGRPNATTCSLNKESGYVYINILIVTTTVILAFIPTSIFITRIGHKKLLCGLNFGAACCAIALYFSQGRIMIVIFISLFMASTTISLNVLYAAIVDIFPTTIRTFALSFAMTCARGAVSVGNLLFPVLVRVGCLPPFIMLAVLLCVCTFLTGILPNTKR